MKQSKTSSRPPKPPLAPPITSAPKLPPARPITRALKLPVGAKSFFLNDLGKTLFPLRTNKVRGEAVFEKFVEYAKSNSDHFLPQSRVFAMKQGGHLRRTFKLDPVAEMFLYDLLYRNRNYFRRPTNKQRETFGYNFVNGDSIYQENVSAVAVAPWGVVSGTRDGIARRWILDRATLSKYGAENLKLGRSIQRMSALAEEVVVAAGQNLVFINDHFEIDRKIPIDFTIADMCPMDHTSLIICGEGALAQVKLNAGKYTKYIAASEAAKYTCVAGIDSKTFCAGNDDGIITVFDVESEAEIGTANVPFPLRGMIRVSDKLVVYGGSWRSKSQKTVAVLDWEEILHRSREFDSGR